MNPGAEKLRHAMSVVEIKWLQDNADTVAELVDAAIALHEENNRPGGWLTAAEERLARAVADFKGPQGPPEPTVQSLVGCPACAWHRTVTSGPDIAGDKQRQLGEAFREHYRMSHQGGKP